MKLTRYDSIRDFREVTAGFLLENEAENHLIIGIVGDLMHSSSYDDHPPYLAVVSDDGQIHATAVRTPPYQLVISRATATAANLIASDAYSLYPDLPGVLGPSATARDFSEAWRSRSGRAFELTVAQRIYQTERVTPPEHVAGELRPATMEDYELLLRWFEAFEHEAYGEGERPQSAERLVTEFLSGNERGLGIWHDGQAVSMAGYKGPTPNGIRIGPVYTPPEWRRRGYGSACTAALSQHLLDIGYRSCFLFTDLSNPISNSIY
ncbi:MAG: GNAT family N-acetyltransferase [Thermomicrobiales bacterium]